jgi:Pyridoxamine 5'-phosphate oxidase
MTKEFLYDFIRKQKFAVLATVSPDSYPESVCVGIAVTRELKLIFDTVSDSRKYRISHTLHSSLAVRVNRLSSTKEKQKYLTVKI